MRLMLDRRLIARFDIYLLLSMLLIVSLGTLTIYSASFLAGARRHSAVRPPASHVGWRRFDRGFGDGQF